jgi:hypothetical protein
LHHHVILYTQNIISRFASFPEKAAKPKTQAAMKEALITFFFQIFTGKNSAKVYLLRRYNYYCGEFS